jgi:hypothetical protein
MSRRLAAALAIVVPVLAGCLDANGPSAQPTATRVPEPSAVTTTYDLDTTVWYEGLILHFDRATAELDQRGGPVNVALRVENPGADTAELDAGIFLNVAGMRVEATRESRVSSVPGKGITGALLTYELQGVASAKDAVLEVGSAPDHIGKVPLTAAGGEAATLQPIKLDLEGTATAIDLKITIRGGELRRDLPDWSQELSAGLLAVTIRYDVTYAGSFAGGFAFTGSNVALRLPDGTRVHARQDGHSQSVELIAARKTRTGLFSRFEIPSDATGAFELLVRNGSTEKAIPVSLVP